MSDNPPYLPTTNADCIAFLEEKIELIRRHGATNIAIVILHDGDALNYGAVNGNHPYTMRGVLDEMASQFSGGTVESVESTRKGKGEVITLTQPTKGDPSQ